MNLLVRVWAALMIFGLGMAFIAYHLNHPPNFGH